MSGVHSGPLDATLPLLRDPYRYATKVRARTGADAIATRLAFEPALIVAGVAAARRFYAPGLFVRENAMPAPLRKTLFGVGGLQGLDGPRHIRRKAFYMEAIGPERVAPLAERAVAALRAWLDSPEARKLPGQDIFARALTEAACDWAGAPLGEGDVERLAETFGSIYEGSGVAGPDHLRARRGRRDSDAWCGDMIRRTRSGEIAPPPGSPLAVLANWREPDGTLLPAEVAAVELGSLLRPTVAVSGFLTFAGHALATEPGLAARLRTEPGLVDGFVQEVRRLYPFFPVLAARAAKDMEWYGHSLPEGHLVVLDIPGTNRDPSVWEDPDAFRPERFSERQIGAYDMIPQGGGVHAIGHRCPGEWATIAIMRDATRAVLLGLDWEALPRQDLTLTMGSAPAFPRDRLRLPPAERAAA